MHINSHKNHHKNNKRKHIQKYSKLLNEETQYGYQFRKEPYLLNSPQEVLTYCTSFLDPQSLIALGNTCRALGEHIRDDNTWRRAFAYHFYGITPEISVEDSSNGLMLRRAYKSWKREFISRFNLLKQYEKSRVSTVTHWPTFSQVHSMHLMVDGNSLLSASLQYGIVARSRPINGKVLKGYLTASSSHLGIGNPNMDFSPHVTSLCIGPTSSPNGAAVLWGFGSGEVALTIANKVMADGARAQTRYLRSRVGEEHQKSVMHIKALSEGYWATGDNVGRIKLWEGTPKRLRLQWESLDDLDDCCIEIAGDVGPNRTGLLFAGFASGSVMLYTHLSTDELSTIDEKRKSNGIVIMHEVIQMDIRKEQVTQMTLILGPYATADFIEALYCDYNNRNSFTRITINLEQGAHRITRTEYFLNSYGSMTTITPSFTNTPGEKSFVLGGDGVGCVHLWEWYKSNEIIAGRKVHPVNTWSVYEDEAVSTIQIGENVIATGSSKGRVVLHSALNFVRLRTFAPVHDYTLSNVDQIILQDETVLWNVGSKVACWRVGNVIQEAKGKMRAKGRISPKQVSKWIERAELKADLAEATKIIEDQRRHKMKVAERVQSQNQVLNNLGLDESEAIEYALMLSRETAQQEAGRGYIVEGVFIEDEQLETQQRVAPSSSVVLNPTQDDEESVKSTNLATGSAVSLGFTTLHTDHILDETHDSLLAGNVHFTTPSSTSAESAFPALSSSLGSFTRQSSRQTSHALSPSQWGRFTLARGSANNGSSDARSGMPSSSSTPPSRGSSVTSTFSHEG